MKKLNHLLLAAMLLIVFAPGLTGQVKCPNSVFADNFSSPSLWTVMGTNTSNPGTLAITGGATVYDDFRGRQSYRLVRNMNGALVNDLFFRMEFETIITEDANLSGAMLMALTSDDSHPRTATGGSYVETDNNTIEVLLSNPLGTSSPGDDDIWLSSKLGTIRGAASTRIPINRNQLYYLRVERIRPGTVVLSIFDDPARTNHIPGSPVCHTIDEDITDLNFLQQGVWTTSSQNRFMTGYTDNLCIFDNVIYDGCEVECLLEPSLSIVDNGNCSFTFTNTSTAGPGTTLFPFGRIDFGDGTWASLPPGASITHSYANFAAYQVSLLIRGYDADYRCCEERIDESVVAQCEELHELGKKAPHFLNDLEVYPNPSEGTIKVRSTEQLGLIHIIDAAGRLVRTVETEGNSLELDLGDLEKGLYILEMESKGQKIQRKISLM